MFVFRPVRIQQIDRAAAHIDPPGLEVNLGHRDLDHADQRLAFGVQHRLDGQVLRVKQCVVLRLPIILIDRLLKITFAVKQADADEAKAQIAGRFCVIARQDSQTSGGNRQTFMEAELGAEVGHRTRQQRWRMLSAPGILLIKICLEIPQDIAHPLSELMVLQPHPEFVIGNFMENGDRIVIEILPASRREFLENFLGVLVPCPPEVPCQPMQTL